jgi:pimeloyl-ACP methyl ester carboxylesterase
VSIAPRAELHAEYVHVVASGRGSDAAIYRAREPRIGTLVFVHGAGCDHHVAEPLAHALPDFDVVAPDLPGRSGTPGEPCTNAAEAAAFVGAVIDALAQHDDLALQGALVLGHSYGGAIAIELALARELSGLVLASTGARLRVAPDLLAGMGLQALASTQSIGLVGWSPGADPSIVARLDAHARAVPSATSVADWHAANAFDRLGQLDVLRTPALLLSGADDLLTPPKYAQYLAAHLSGAQLELLPRAGHLLPLDEPARIAPLIRAFALANR